MQRLEDLLLNCPDPAASPNPFGARDAGDNLFSEMKEALRLSGFVYSVVDHPSSDGRSKERSFLPENRGERAMHCKSATRATSAARPVEQRTH